MSVRRARRPALPRRPRSGLSLQSRPKLPASHQLRATGRSSHLLRLAPTPHSDPSTRVGRSLTTYGASNAGSVSLHLSILLAGAGHLVVLTRPYVVRAALGLAPDPGFSLPSASADRCNDRRRASQPARTIGASWRTADLVDPDPLQTGQSVFALEQAAGDPLQDPAHASPADSHQFGDPTL